MSDKSIGPWSIRLWSNMPLRMRLQSSDRIGIVKKHVKRGQAGLGAVPKAFWAMPVRFPALNKGKSIENWQIGTRDSLFGAVAA